MFSFPYWLHTPQIGPKKIVAVYGLFFLGSLFPSKHVFLFLAIGFTIFLIRQLTVKGYQHRLYQNKDYSLVDRLYPFHPHKNRRTILDTSRRFLLSQVFLQTQQNKKREDFFFNIVRLLYEQWFSPAQVTNVLFLGGAGCSLPLLFASIYKKITITVVEIDKTMIELAQKYFFPLFRLKKSTRLSLIHADAYTFMRENNTKKYDFIFQDISQDDHVPEIFATEKWLQIVTQCLKNNGVALINCGTIISPITIKNLLRLKKRCHLLKVFSFEFRKNYFFAAQKTAGNKTKRPLNSKKVIDILKKKKATLLF